MLRERHAWCDAAALPAGRWRSSVDCAVAGRHFPWPSKRARSCGYRALAAALSDLAAVGARPMGFLMSAVFDGSPERARRELIRGIADCAQDYQVELWGGNLSRGQLQFHLTVFGRERFPRASRGPARPGDLLWVTGTHGDALADLADLCAGRRPMTGRYFRPEPRFEWGQRLWRQRWLTAMADVSDGWLCDAARLCRGFGLRVDPQAVPRSSAVRKRLAGPAATAAIYWGGDDYELVFATRGLDRSQIRCRLDDLEIPAACIGQVERQSGVRFFNRPDFPPLPELGYDPFAIAPLEGSTTATTPGVG